MRTHYLCVTLLLAQAAFAQTAPVRQAKAEADVKEATGSASLPVKKVVLYKNGVGYFEHTGRVHGNQELGIEFTTAQLNDVLKSLTVVDLNVGKISGVRYNSMAPLSERLKSLQIPLSEDVTSAAFLIALRGTRVEVRNGAASTLGKVFSVDKTTSKNAFATDAREERWVMTSSAGIGIVLATIPPLRGPTRHSSARKRKSGRSGRDDSGAKSGRPQKAAPTRAREPKTKPTRPLLQSDTRVRCNDDSVGTLPRWGAACCVPTRAGESQERAAWKAALQGMRGVGAGATGNGGWWRRGVFWGCLWDGNRGI